MKKTGTQSFRRFLAAALCFLMTLALFSGTALADDTRMTGISVKDDMYVAGDAQSETITGGLEITTTGEEGGIGVDIQSFNDPVSVTVSGGAIRVNDQSSTGHEAMGVCAAAVPGGSVSLNLDADVSVTTASTGKNAAAYGVKLGTTHDLVSYYILDENGVKLPVRIFEASYATHVLVEQDGVDVTEQYSDLWAFFLFADEESGTEGLCDLYMLTQEGEIRYRSCGLPASIARSFWGYDTMVPSDGSEPVVAISQPVTVTLYASDDDPGTEVVIKVLKDPGASFGPGSGTQKQLFKDAKGNIYLQPDNEGDLLIDIFTQRRTMMQEYTGFSVDAVLGGSITAESSGDVSGLNIMADNGPVTVTLQPGMEIDATGRMSEGILCRSIKADACVNGQDLSIQARNASAGDSNAIIGIHVIGAATTSVSDSGAGGPVTNQSVVTLTGDNHIIVRPQGMPKYAAGIVTDATAMGSVLNPPTGIAQVNYEGDIDASGIGAMGIQALISVGPMKRMGSQRSIVNMVGDVNVSNSDSDALYTETRLIPDPAMALMLSQYDAKAEIYLRGNVNITNGIGDAAGVSTTLGTVIVDGDITVSGDSDQLIGVYAYKSSTVLVTGEITAPTSVLIPTDEGAFNSRVYIWKDTGLREGKTGQIGYVIKVDEGLDAVPSGSSLYTAEREGRTYYGADAGDTITVTTSRSDIRVLDANGTELPIEQTAGGYTFTMPADCGVTVTHVHALTPVAEIPAACETAGTAAHYVCGVCGKLFADAEGTTETTLEALAIPAAGHAWGEPVWSWGGTAYAAATFTCTADPTHTMTLPAQISGTGVTGAVTYTATVYLNGRAYTDTVTRYASPVIPFPQTQPTAPVIPTQPQVTMPTVPTEPTQPAAPTEPTVAVPSFYDVPADAYYADAVAWAVSKGITSGTDANHFSPDLTCTRAQMVTFLWRAAGCPEPGPVPHAFADLEPGAYYLKAVEWAVAKGITNGITESEFGPEQTVTRAQAVAFLYRFANAQAEPASVFDDVPADAWFAPAVTWAAENGIAQGIGPDLFGPYLPCTRAQIVTFLQRFSVSA